MRARYGKHLTIDIAQSGVKHGGPLSELLLARVPRGANQVTTVHRSMIFGFNTDAKHADTVYHVQSEARANALMLETQVFVRGRCLGKHATSYADRVDRPDFSEQYVHELLKQQHRAVLDAVREGRVEQLLAARPGDADGPP